MDPIEKSDAVPSEIVAETAVAVDAAGHIAEIPVVPLADVVTTADGIARALTILGAEIHPGSYQRLSWSATELELTEVKHGVKGIETLLNTLGMARNQVVMPGFAAFHIGIQTYEAPVEFSDNDRTGLPTEDESDDYVDGMSE